MVGVPTTLVLFDFSSSFLGMGRVGQKGHKRILGEIDLYTVDTRETQERDWTAGKSRDSRRDYYRLMSFVGPVRLFTGDLLANTLKKIVRVKYDR